MRAEINKRLKVDKSSEKKSSYIKAGIKSSAQNLSESEEEETNLTMLDEGAYSSERTDDSNSSDSESVEIGNICDSENEFDSVSDSKNMSKSDSFDTAMSAILGSKIKAHHASNPILTRNKIPAKKLEDEKAEAKVRKVIRAEKIHHKDKARVKMIIPIDPEEAGDVLANEKKLRKIAQRGAVKLLNAINIAQAAAVQNSDTHGFEQKKNKANTELSKEKFLDMIRSG